MYFWSAFSVKDKTIDDQIIYPLRFFLPWDIEGDNYQTFGLNCLLYIELASTLWKMSISFSSLFYLFILQVNMYYTIKRPYSSKVPMLIIAICIIIA